MYVPAKKNHTSTTDERSSRRIIPVDRNSHCTEFWMVVDMNTVMPLEHIISTGRSRKMAV